MSNPAQLSLLQQIDSLALRTVGTDLHRAVLEMRSTYLSDFSIMRHVHCPDMVAVVLPLVSKQFGVDARLLTAPDRSKQVTHARHAAMWILRNIGQLSYPAIAAALARRDHTTTLNGCRRIDALRQQDVALSSEDRRTRAALRRGNRPAHLGYRGMNAALLRVALWTVIPIGLLIVAARTLTRPRTVEIDDYTRAEMAEMQTQHAEYVRR